MKLVGLMPARNEAHCLGLTTRAALMWVDELYILNHFSTDGTTDIIVDLVKEYPGRVSWNWVNSPIWDEMAHRQMMLERARGRGATHIAMIDADEILTGNLLNCKSLAVALTAGLDSRQVLDLPGYNLRGALNNYHANGVWGKRWFSLAFEDDSRLSWTGDKFHSRKPNGLTLAPWTPIGQGQGGVMHIWGVNGKRLIARHALYKITERLRFPEKPIEEIELTYNDWRSPEDNAKHWPEMKRFREPWTYASTPSEWWSPYAHLMRYLDIDAEPWQTKECQQLVAEHGKERFAGLDLFGVA